MAEKAAKELSKAGSSIVRYCGCTGVSAFLAGSGKRPESRALVTVPFHTRNRGAEFQDAAYGKGMRVFTVGKKTQSSQPLSCTVCGVRAWA